MLIRAFQGRSPVIDPSARLAENAAVIGDVSLGENVTVWYGAVLRGDVGAILVGKGSNIQDNCVFHCGLESPTTVGENVIVGHGAILHSCTVGDNCLIGMGATLLDGCVIGEGSIIGAGALVPPGKVIPPRSMVMGVPGRVVRAVTEEEVAHTLHGAALYVELGREQLEPVPGKQAEKP